MLKALRPYLRHLAGRRRALAALFALGLLASAAALASPLIGRAFIDAVVGRKDFRSVPLVAMALVGLAAGDLLLGACARWIHARLSAGVLSDLRAELFRSCLTSPLERIEGFRHGDLLTRFGTDVPRIQVLIVDGLLGAAQHAIFLAIAAAILIELSLPLALWSFAGVALALIATAAFRGPVESKAREVRGAMANLSHFLSERLSALRPIRFHRTEDEERERLSTENQRLSRAVVRYQMLDSAVTGAPGLLLTLALAWIYVIGGRLLEAGQITLGTFVAFVLYQGRLFSPAQGILALLRNLQESRVSVDRVGEVLGAVTARPPVPEATSRERSGAGIVFEGVSFAYAGKPPVLRDVSLRVSPGERVALFGASGAGKSTLVQLLFGMRTPDSGAIRVGAFEPGALNRSLRDVVGFAGAEPFLVHATVEENVRYGSPCATPEGVARALRLAEADVFVAALPHGLETVVGGRGLSLSDGQRQRIGLARLFLRDPQVLVLDEAFSALDLETEARIRRNMWQGFPDRTAIVISHRPVGLEEFDRILLLQGGRLTLVDPKGLARMLASSEKIPSGRPNREADIHAREPSR